MHTEHAAFLANLNQPNRKGSLGGGTHGAVGVNERGVKPPLDAVAVELVVAHDKQEGRLRGRYLTQQSNQSLPLSLPVQAKHSKDNLVR